MISKPFRDEKITIERYPLNWNIIEFKIVFNLINFFRTGIPVPIPIPFLDENVFQQNYKH